MAGYLGISGIFHVKREGERNYSGIFLGIHWRFGVNYTLIYLF